MKHAEIMQRAGNLSTEAAHICEWCMSESCLDIAYGQAIALQVKLSGLIIGLEKMIHPTQVAERRAIAAKLGSAFVPLSETAERVRK